MPLYTYKCSNNKCNKILDKIAKAEVTHISCPDCGRRSDRQLTNIGGVVFKGNGFYATDYKRKG